MTMEIDDQIWTLPAYWHKKRKWVSVPLYHIPKEAIDEEGDLTRFQVIPLDGKKIESIPKRSYQCSLLIEESIVPWLWASKAIKQLCTRNDIPLSWITLRFQRGNKHKSESVNRRKERKNTPLKPREFRRVLKALSKINKRTALIAQILWFFNRSIGKEGSFVTCEELLRVKVQDVAPEESGANWIQLMRSGFNCSHLIHYVLPQYLWKALNQQIHPYNLFVFSNKYGGPLLSGQIDVHFRRAGKLAGIKTMVTSLALRPIFNKKRILHTSKKTHEDAFTKEQLEYFTRKEWDQICKNIPSIAHRRGRKSIYHPCDVLNAIVYHLNTKCPIRKLPPPFPPGRAVDSQYRRWQKHDVIEKIFKWRQSVSIS